MTCETCHYYMAETPDWGTCVAPVPDSAAWSFETEKKSTVLMKKTDGKECPAFAKWVNDEA